MHIIPTYTFSVAEHRAMIHGALGPLDRWGDSVMADWDAVRVLDDEDITGSFSASLPVDAPEDGADALGAGED